MWSRAVSGANQSGDEHDHWLMPQEQLPVSNAGMMSVFEADHLEEPSMSYAHYQDQMSMTCSAPLAFDSSLTVEQTSMYQPVPGFHYITPTQTQQNSQGISSTPTLTHISSPTFDGASLSTVEPFHGPAFYLPESAVQETGQAWYTFGAQQTQPSHSNVYPAGTLSSGYQPTSVISYSPPNLQGSEVASPILQRKSSRFEEKETLAIDGSSSEQQSFDADSAETNDDVVPGRHHRHYKVKPNADGLYHCPYHDTGHAATRCLHEPTKLKCNYDKYIDSHLKPYRCKQKGCESLRFSSTACRLRHEREAHGSHGHGKKPFLCIFTDCERSRPDKGFPRQWNARDHMKRVHDYNELTGKLGSDAGSSVTDFSIPVQRETSVAPSLPAPSRKRAHESSHSPPAKPIKMQRRTSSPKFEPSLSPQAIAINPPTSLPQVEQPQVTPSMASQWQTDNVTEQWRERLISMAQNLKRPEDVARIRREISTWDETAQIYHV